jgi:hypothetical protein
VPDDFTITLNRRDAEFLLRALDAAVQKQSTQPTSDYSHFVEEAAKRLHAALRGEEG